jgi:hypothetical protein
MKRDFIDKILNINIPPEYAGLLPNREDFLKAAKDLSEAVDDPRKSAILLRRVMDLSSDEDTALLSVILGGAPNPIPKDLCIERLIHLAGLGALSALEKIKNEGKQ